MTYPAERYLKAYGMALQWCERVEHCLAQLPDRERILLMGRYGLAERVSVPDLEDELSVSERGYYRVRKSALKKIWTLFEKSGVSIFWQEILEHMCYNSNQ